jgi:hypothetical protein
LNKINADKQTFLNAFDKFWLLVGKEYCREKNFYYIENIKSLRRVNIIYESGIIVIALDKSISMGGSKWRNANESIKELIEYLRECHSDVKKIHICIIHFNHEAEVIYSD